MNWDTDVPWSFLYDTLYVYIWRTEAISRYNAYRILAYDTWAATVRWVNIRYIVEI